MLDRSAALAWYRRNRERTAQLFALLSERAYYSRPIALRHPLVFYEGHLPAFSFNTLVKKGLGRSSIDPRLETLFARGIDPHEASSSGNVTAPADQQRDGWPERKDVLAFAAEADALVVQAITHA